MSQAAAPVICDGCLKDISTTGNSNGYCLRLSSYSPPPWYTRDRRTLRRGGVVTDMAVYPMVDDDRHFCNDLDCVRAWLDGEDAVAARALARQAREGTDAPLGTSA